MGERLKCVEQGFSTFFDSRHPFLVIKHYDGTPSYKLLVNGHKNQNLAAPLELFGAPKSATAPRLRTTGVERRRLH